MKAKATQANEEYKDSHQSGAGRSEAQKQDPCHDKG
jgi:hypothetical protein